ncbi:MAG TPA: flagellar motor protein MotD [Methylophilaceae bacterium]
MARRKKHAEEHENLERWLVSYADFITLLFAFFVVLYALSILNTSKYKALAESLRASFDYTTSPDNQPSPGQSSMGQTTVTVQPNKPEIAPAEDQKKQQERQNMKAIASDVQQALETLVREGKVQVTETARGISIEINASVLFDTAKADLHSESISALSAVAQVLAKDNHQIQVEGHTDNQPISSFVFPSNWELSAARSGSVIRLFEKNGVDGGRMVAIGYADKRPVAPNDTPESRARNRRVTIMVLAEGGNNSGVQGTGLAPDVRAALAPLGDAAKVTGNASK